MRIAYGYLRREADFDGLNVDRIWIDGKKSDRQERQAMLKHGIRRRETLVLLSRADLGQGKALLQIEADLKAREITIEVNEPIRLRGKPGPKPEWEPTGDEDARFQRLWKDITVDGPYVIRQALEAAKMPVTKETRQLMRQRLVRRYGARSK